MNSFLHTTTFSLTVLKSISAAGTQLGIVESEYSVNLEVLEMDISEYTLLQECSNILFLQEVSAPSYNDIVGLEKAGNVVQLCY